MSHDHMHPRSGIAAGTLKRGVSECVWRFSSQPLSSARHRSSVGAKPSAGNTSTSLQSPLSPTATPATHAASWVSAFLPSARSPVPIDVPPSQQMDATDSHLDASLLDGSSAPCPTFDNLVLAHPYALPNSSPPSRPSLVFQEHSFRKGIDRITPRCFTLDECNASARVIARPLLRNGSSQRKSLMLRPRDRATRRISRRRLLRHVGVSSAGTSSVEAGAHACGTRPSCFPTSGAMHTFSFWPTRVVQQREESQSTEVEVVDAEPSSAPACHSPKHPRSPDMFSILDHHGLRAPRV
ncbi:hypothetical protein BDR04DRAFT_1164716 [Suillus decipiens]|nr:hypothetical protein BDR04DRAFT_1164716 [Suillus decipiens]